VYNVPYNFSTVREEIKTLFSINNNYISVSERVFFNKLTNEVNLNNADFFRYGSGRNFQAPYFVSDSKFIILN